MAPQNLFSNLSGSTPSQSPKMHLTTGDFPAHIDFRNSPSSARSPFRQLHANPYVARITIVLPRFLASSLTSGQAIPSPTASTTTSSRLQPPPPALIQARCFVTLNDIIGVSSRLLSLIQTPSSLDLFLLSEGGPGADDFFHLHAGTLTIDVSRERYEKMGIPGGVVVKSGARKHGKQGERRKVQVDLRSVTARVLERWRRAAREVWVARVGCLVAVDGGNVEEQQKARELLDGLAAVWIDGTIKERVESGIRVPLGLLTRGVSAEGTRLEQDEDATWSLVEWADLVALGSQRPTDADRVDDFVARFEVPEKDSAETVTQDLAVLAYEGLISSRWVVELLLRLVKASRTQQEQEQHHHHHQETPWAVFTINTHRTEAVGNVDGCMLLLQPTTTPTRASPPTQDLALASSISRSNPGHAHDGATNYDGKTLDDELVEGGIQQGGEHQQQQQQQQQQQTPALRLDFNTRNSGGLQRFVCMQFVDSRVHS